MTVYLTDRAQKLVSSLRGSRRDIHEMIALYDRWPNQQLSARDGDGESRTDEMLRSADRAASCIDPRARPDLVETVVGHMAAAERAGSRSAALYAATLQMMHEQRTGLVPTDEVFDS